MLGDGTNTYLYGAGRLGEVQPSGFAYHVGDALGSVRQLVLPDGEVALARTYEPFGNTLASVGDGATAYQFTGEARDGTGLTFLRARFYSSSQGRFVTRDPWRGNPKRALSYNVHLYAYANPIGLTDPSGREPICPPPPAGLECWGLEEMGAAFGISFSGAWRQPADETGAYPSPRQTHNWLDHDKLAVVFGAEQVGIAFSRVADNLGASYTPDDAFRRVFGPTRFHLYGCDSWDNDCDLEVDTFADDPLTPDVDESERSENPANEYWCQHVDRSANYPVAGVGCFNEAVGRMTPRFIAHELGHHFNYVATFKGINPYSALSTEGIFTGAGTRIAGWDSTYCNGEWRTNDRGQRYCSNPNQYYRTSRGYGQTQWNTGASASEDFADMFSHWSFGRSSFSYDPYGYGDARYAWMESHMHDWVGKLLNIATVPDPKSDFDPYSCPPFY